jgi:hypothetical protein
MNRPGSAAPWTSWGPLAAAAILTGLGSLWVALTPAGEQTELASRTWAQFAQGDREVASLYGMDLVILGLMGAGFGLLGGVVSAIPYRLGERWAWYASWLIPLTIGVVAARMLVDQYSAGYFSAALAAVAMIGLLLPVRRVLGRDKA